MSDVPLLEMKGITKRFPGVLALDNVDFAVRSGEVHALVGENGAGKSTLMKILGGAYRADGGEMYLNGKQIELHSPADGISAGLNVVYQELVLAPHLSVAENILMGRLPRANSWTVDWKAAEERAREVLRQVEVDIDVRRTVRSLSVVQQQIVEIARALQRESRVLVLDEPSAVLGKHDIELLYKVINRLKKQGIGLVYISHRLDEVFFIADRVTVLRNGKLVGTTDISGIDQDTLVHMMIGRELTQVYQRTDRTLGEEVLRVEGLTRRGEFEDVSFGLRRGEILGIAGLVGSGRTELARVIAGADRPDGGRIYVMGKEVRVRSPREALRRGIGLLPEDRNQQGLFLKRPVVENVTVASLEKYTRFVAIDLVREERGVRELMRGVAVKATGPNQLVRNLSGGNRQKVMLSRWLETKSRILIFDEPTRGVDIGAKVDIYKLMDGLASNGIAIIMISSELPEILGMADNILVLWRGQVAGTFSREQVTREQVLQTALLGANNGK